MPTAFIPPSEPVLRDAPPTGKDWTHELKWDGYRCQVHVEGGAARLYSKSGKLFDRRFASVRAAAAALPCRSAVIDAEIIAMDPQGKPDFRALHGGQKHDLGLACFDLMELNGKDLTKRPLAVRRMQLRTLLGKAQHPAIVFSDSFTDPFELLAVVDRMGLEGIVSKKLSQPYQSGRNSAWLKVKTHAWRARNAKRRMGDRV